MFLNTELWLRALLAIAVGFAVSFASTPIVKTFAQKVGAMDVPKDARRVHDHPIPAWAVSRSSSASFSA